MKIAVGLCACARTSLFVPMSDACIFMTASRRFMPRKTQPMTRSTSNALNAFEKTGPGTGGIAPGANGGRFL